ncbi:MAG: MBOAT family O-acyltransferase, partial [Bacteroidia bacterium]
GLTIERSPSKKMLGFGIAGNLGLLVWFKYSNFLTYNANELLGSLHLGSIPVSHIVLPIGISFYSFHSISYLIDVFHKKSDAQKNIFDMALYIVLFSQLVAGPIIRYNVFAPQLLQRRSSMLQFSVGVERFITGLGKKVLIANTLARLADESFSQNLGSMSTLLSWLGALCYTFQIYFDFSGYSDMAIGLSKMFGFEFPENFNLPYIASSIQDFWKRWHISLSSFFRDYLYIPLGGNKKGKVRTYINMVIVFLLTGFWHGANYTFILWGLLHGTFLLIERTGFKDFLERIPMFLRRSYTFIIVLLLWIPFRSDNIKYSMSFFRSLLPNGNDLKLDLVGSYFTTDFIIALSVAFILAFNLHSLIGKLLARLIPAPGIGGIISTFFLFSVLFFSAVYLIAGTYNPFIYYQF